MIVNKSIGEDAALGYFKDLDYAVGDGLYLPLGDASAERETFSKVALLGRMGEAPIWLKSVAKSLLCALGTSPAARLPGESGTREVEEFQVSGFKSSLTQRRRGFGVAAPETFNLELET